MLSRTLLAASLLSLASAHFQLTWPPSRGFDEEKIVDYPCGGFDTALSNRTALPLNSAFPLQLDMEHTSVKGMVVLALGNSPTGNDYKIVLKPIFQETGPQEFCIGGVTLPSNLNITEGTNGTIQVLTNGDPSGGLYQCTDVTFTSAAFSQAEYNSHCTNSTGVTASFISGGTPNGTSDSTTSSSASASNSAAASATSKAAGAKQTVGALLLGAAGVVGFAAL